MATATVALAVSKSMLNVDSEVVHMARVPSMADEMLSKMLSHGAVSVMAGTDREMVIRRPVLASCALPVNAGFIGMHMLEQFPRTKLCDVSLQAMVKQDEDGLHSNPVEHPVLPWQLGDVLFKRARAATTDGSSQ